MLLIISGIEVHPGPCHMENHGKCCALCLLKGNRIISSTHILKIQEIVPEYDYNNKCLPSGICNKCRSKLGRDLKQVKKPDYTKIFQNGNLIWTREKEYNKNSCKCLICEVASSNGGDYAKLQNKILGNFYYPKSQFLSCMLNNFI